MHGAFVTGNSDCAKPEAEVQGVCNCQIYRVCIFLYIFPHPLDQAPSTFLRCLSIAVACFSGE